MLTAVDVTRLGAVQSVEVFSGAHTNDVNAVAFMQDDANIIVSGSDDNTCKVRPLHSFQLAS